MLVNTPLKAFVADLLAEIDLSENRLGECGIKALASMLLENTSLISLNLSGNHLDERAAKHLAPALTKNQHLQHLDLSHNRLGEAAGTAWGREMKANDERLISESFTVLCSYYKECSGLSLWESFPLRFLGTDCSQSLLASYLMVSKVWIQGSQGFPLMQKCVLVAK